jgi:hypothetical protein
MSAQKGTFLSIGEAKLGKSLVLISNVFLENTP